MRVSVIGDFDTVTGFKLAGVQDANEIKEPSEAVPLLKKKIKDEDVGVIIITERIAEEIRDDIRPFTEDLVMPIIVEIPDKKGPLEMKVDPIKEMVRRAVGVDIKTD
jgi:V/A-type H+-transporting ATPase subunit F